jgi:hypothetical protein
MARMDRSYSPQAPEEAVNQRKDKYQILAAVAKRGLTARKQEPSAAYIPPKPRKK